MSARYASSLNASSLHASAHHASRRQRLTGCVQQGWLQITRFNWQQLRQPASAGSWPVPVLLLMLLVLTGLLSGIAGALSAWLAPNADRAEQAEIASLHNSILVGRLAYRQAAAEQLELTRRGVWLRPVLHQAAAAADITLIMQAVRAAAVTNNVQLLSAVPDFVVSEQRTLVSVRARLRLMSLAEFWRALTDAGLPFSVHGLGLTATEKPDIFALDVMLAMPSATPLSTAWVTQRSRLSAAPAHIADSLGAEAENTPMRAPHKGFLLRSGTANPQFVYLVRDDHGRLKGMTEQGDVADGAR